MTTLRRELRLKFEEVIKNSDIYDNALSNLAEMGHEDQAPDMLGDLCRMLADAALSLRAFKFEPQTVEQAIYAGVPVTEKIVSAESVRSEAVKMFEAALGFSKRLPWWDGDKDWKELGEWVCERYQEDRTCFGEYNIWRNTKYTKGGISNTRLRGFPSEFYDSWDMFMMSRPKKSTEKPSMFRTINS